jgi:hypothetical protein
LSVLGDTVAMAEVGLGGSVCWRARVHADLGAGEGANEAERVRGAKASRNRATRLRCRAVEGPPRWSGGSGAPAYVVWPQGWVTAYRT